MNVVLNLPIKGKWFNMIACGVKCEEYRDCEHKQVQRAFLWAANDPYWGLTKPVAVFRNGYNMDSRALIVQIVGFDLRHDREALPCGGSAMTRTSCSTAFGRKGI